MERKGSGDKISITVSKELEKVWPTEKIDKAIEELFEYLSEFQPEDYKYTKYAIMGPVGKLLSALQGEQFEDNVSSYVGYVANIHSQESWNRHSPSTKAYSKIKSAVETIIDIKKELTGSQRTFNRVIRAIDYGVFFKKSEEIAQKHEDKMTQKEEANENKLQ